MKDLSNHQHNSGQQTFTCPMHPQVIKQAPGKCPVCGMTLEPVDKKPK